MARRSPVREKDPETIKRKFYERQSRQIIAIAIALFLVLLSAVIYKQPERFGNFSKDVIFGMQAWCIATFIGFTAFNWRCPSCNRYLGADIHREVCKKCRTRLR